MANRTWYIYNPEVPLSPDEEAVRARNYPYVSTTRLGRRGGFHLDRLNDHSHHSWNTHLITKGSIKIGRARQDGFWTRPTIYGPGTWADMPPGVTYRGEAGNEGCEFVEGHTVLSPTTARRFFDRRTIVAVPQGTPGAFTTS